MGTRLKGRWRALLALVALTGSSVLSLANAMPSWAAVSPDGKLSLTVSTTTPTVPIGGATVYINYRVENLSTTPMIFEGLTDNTCGNIDYSTGMTANAAARTWTLAPGAAASFTCSKFVDVTSTGQVLATFSDPSGVATSVAENLTITAPISVNTNTSLWYSTVDSGAGAGGVGIWPNAATWPMFSSGDFNDARAFTINPQDCVTAYAAVSDPTGAALVGVDLTQNGQADLSLNFGFVLGQTGGPEPTPTPTPAPAPTPVVSPQIDSGLVTDSGVSIAGVLFGLSLLGAGLGGLILRRRKA